MERTSWLVKCMGVIVVVGITALKQHLNSEVCVTDYFEVSQDRISQFGEITKDRQWIHTDVERAGRESPFGGTVAHGFLTLSLLSHFLAAGVKVDGSKLMVNLGLNSVRFLTPIPAGARIRARVRLRECSEDQDFVQATWRFTIECEGSRLPSCTADWIVRYY